MIASPAHLLPLPVPTALTGAMRLSLAAPLALVAAVLLLVGLAFALATIALHPYLGRLLWGPLEEAAPAGAADRSHFSWSYGFGRPAQREHGSGRS